MKTKGDRIRAACYQLNELAFAGHSVANLAEHTMGVIACGATPSQESVEAMARAPFDRIIRGVVATIKELREAIEDERRPCRIVVNGREHETAGRSLSYWDVVKASGVHGNPTVTYCRADGGSSGILVDGETVAVQDGTVFNVTRTDNA
jgi:hypothetical protein